MSDHRYPCQADPYPLIGSLDSLGHRHACKHDALHRPQHPVVEHACDCGMAWTEHVEMPKTSTVITAEQFARLFPYRCPICDQPLMFAIGIDAHVSVDHSWRERLRHWLRP